jgi:hypothetical protein
MLWFHRAACLATSDHARTGVHPVVRATDANRVRILVGAFPAARAGLGWPLGPSLLGVSTGATVLVTLLARSFRSLYQVTRHGLHAAAMVRILAA